MPAKGVVRGLALSECRLDKRLHVKAVLRGRLLVGHTHGAGAPRQAAALQAVCAFGLLQMDGAGSHVVAAGTEGPDRAGIETGLVGAALARACANLRSGKFQRLAQHNGCAVSVP